MYIEKDSLNNAFIELCKQLLDKGIYTSRRGKRMLEIPSAVLVCITNPTDRYINLPERKWNKTLGWVESLWIARGDNSLEMPAAYVKNLINFSDDGKFMRAGYGPRLRRYGDNCGKMVTSNEEFYHQYTDENRVCEVSSGCMTDQLEFVIEKFNQDITTREAVITIHDPISDNFHIDANNNKVILDTKDTPCTRSIHFMIVDGEMNCYVDIRSNDIWWGFSAVNVFNFTLMQEYVASMVKVPIGKYYHKADNLHVYEDFIPMISKVAKLDFIPKSEHWAYQQNIANLKDFDEKLHNLSEFENICRRGHLLSPAMMESIIVSFIDPLFIDWAAVIYKYWHKDYSEEFINPHLNRLFYGNER